MKIEVARRSTSETIETYVLPGVNVSDFQDWEEALRCIPLDELLSLESELGSDNPETAELMPVSIPVDFFIPTPLRQSAFSLYAEMQTKEQQLPVQSMEDLRSQIIEEASVFDFDVNDVLSAVVVEISQNHLPLSEYEVRMSDG